MKSVTWTDPPLNLVVTIGNRRLRLRSHFAESDSLSRWHRAFTKVIRAQRPPEPDPTSPQGTEEADVAAGEERLRANLLGLIGWQAKLRANMLALLEEEEKAGPAGGEG